MNRLFDIERFVNHNKNQQRMANLDQESGIDMKDRMFYLQKEKDNLDNKLSTEKKIINLSKVKTLGSKTIKKAQENFKSDFQNILDQANKINLYKEKMLNENTRGLVLKYFLGYVIFILLILLITKTKFISIGKGVILVIFVGILLLGFLGYYILI